MTLVRVLAKKKNLSNKRKTFLIVLKIYIKKKKIICMSSCVVTV